MQIGRVAFFAFRSAILNISTRTREIAELPPAAHVLSARSAAPRIMRRASLLRRKVMKSKVAIRSRSDEATQDAGKVLLGDMAPAFTSADSCQTTGQLKKVAP